jgi:YidC/Oxa1 family membrane protein insertase
MDKQSVAIFGLLIAGYLGYHFLYFTPRYEAYQKDVAAWELEQAELDAAAADDPKPILDEPDPDAAPPSSASVAGPDSAAAITGDASPGEVPADASPAGVTEHAHVEGIPFVTPTQSIALSTSGASLSTLTFREETGIRSSSYHPVQSGEADDLEPGPLTILRPYVDEVRSFGLTPLDEELAWVGTADWAHEALDDGGHRFTLDLPSGLRLIKTYERPEAREDEVSREPGKVPSYHFNLRVRVENHGTEPVDFGYWLNGPAGIQASAHGRSVEGVQAVMATRDADDRFEIELEVTGGFDGENDDNEKKTWDEELDETPVAYWGSAGHYFTSLILPVEGGASTRLEAWSLLVLGQGRVPTDAEQEDIEGAGVQGVVRARIDAQTIAPNGGAIEDLYMVYAGPRQKLIFENEGPYADKNLEAVVDFGWFESLAVVILSVLFGIKALCGNWGLAIILLTFLVRGMMLPLSVWSQKNMLRMQKLAPEIQKLKEKFTRKDGTMSREQQQQFSMAQMELWRTHKINPVGCVGPLFLQMPIFFALWKALNISFELRQTSFVLWFTDLSVPDVLFRLPFTLPLLGTNAFSVLPLMMVGTYLLQQQVQPKATEPRAAEQQKMMKYIVPVFGLILYTMPSGLMLYFITSSMWSIVEMKTIKKRIEETETKKAEAKATPAKA